MLSCKPKLIALKPVYLSILLTCCTSILAFSQNKVKVDVIYLKNDSVLIGNILHTVPEVGLTFESHNQDYRYIQLTEIREIKHETYKNANGTIIPISADSLLTRTRYWFWLQGGAKYVLGDNKSVRPQIDMVNGFQRHNLKLGIAVGVRFLEEDLFLVPLYLHLQTGLSNQTVSPIAAIGAGIVSNPKSDWKAGGPFLRGDLGLKAALKSGGFFTLTIGFEQMNFFTNNFLRNETNTLNSLTLNLGVMF